MSITLLLDLDDTLLNTHMEAFIPAYFKALSNALSDMVAPELMFSALIDGVKAMVTNRDPALTLREAFDAQFFPKVALDRPALQARIDHFYDETFSELGSLTSPVPEAAGLVDWAFAQGYRVAIATNPIFPLQAVLHRLRWAGLPPEKYPFALVTSYEKFHFTKEMVAYYPEVLAQLGWPDDPVVMVGDDAEREVRSTRAIGLPVFWVGKNAEMHPELAGVPQGSLASLRGWLEKAPVDALQISFTSPRSLLETLRSTPAALATLTASLPPQSWARIPAPGEWCLTEVICHLRDVEWEVHLPRLRKVLAEQNPFLAGEITDAWVKERAYAKQDGLRALADFTTARKETLALLEGLQAEWTRPARHAIFGPTTLQELTGIAAGHDRAHIQQVWKTMRA